MQSRKKVLVLDNDEMSGSYVLVFAYMSVLSKLLVPENVFYQHVREGQRRLAQLSRDEDDTDMEVQVEDTTLFVMKSFARSMAKFAPNTIFRPGFVEFFQYAYDLKRLGALDAIIMYTAAADGRGGALIETFMGTLLAASIGKGLEQVFNVTISRDRQYRDNATFIQQYQKLVQPLQPTAVYRTPHITIIPAVNILTDAWIKEFSTYTVQKWTSSFGLGHIPSLDFQVAEAQKAASKMANVNDRKSMLYARGLLRATPGFQSVIETDMDVLMFDDSISGIQTLWTYTPAWQPTPEEPVAPADVQPIRPVPGETEAQKLARRLLNYEKAVGKIRHISESEPSKIVQVSRYYFRPNVSQAMGLFVYSLLDLANEVNNTKLLEVLVAPSQEPGLNTFEYLMRELTRKYSEEWHPTSDESTHRDSDMMRMELERFVDRDKLEAARTTLDAERESLDVEMVTETEQRRAAMSDLFPTLESAELGAYFESAREQLESLDLGLIGGSIQTPLHGELDTRLYASDSI